MSFPGRKPTRRQVTPCGGRQHQGFRLRYWTAPVIRCQLCESTGIWNECRALSRRSPPQRSGGRSPCPKPVRQATASDSAVWRGAPFRHPEVRRQRTSLRIKIHRRNERANMRQLEIYDPQRCDQFHSPRTVPVKGQRVAPGPAALPDSNSGKGSLASAAPTSGSSRPSIPALPERGAKRPTGKIQGSFTVPTAKAIASFRSSQFSGLPQSAFARVMKLLPAAGRWSCRCARHAIQN